jgi:hypothetical protein
MFGSTDIGVIAATITYGTPAVGSGLRADAGAGKTDAGSIAAIVICGVKAAGAN